MVEETVLEQTNTNVQEQQTKDADAAVANKIEALQTFLGKDQVDNFKKELGTPSSLEEDNEEEQGNENNEPENEETPEQKLEAEKKAAEEKKAEDAKKTEKKSILGIKKPGEKKNDVVIENPDQILEVVKSKFGQEYKDIKELPKFFETAQGWREKAQKADAAEEKYNQFVDFLNGAPEELVESLRKFEKGEDWTEPFLNRPKFDFSKPVDKQDIKALVNHFYPNKFTEEDFSDENPSELLKMAIDTSKDKFNVEKTTRDTQRAHVTQKAADQLKAQNVSIQSSVARLKQAFPEADEDSVKEVQSVFEGGPNKVLSFFYNNDGTAKPEAAEMLLMAKYGKEEIERMMDITAHTTETKLNEDLVSRGADTKKPAKGNSVMDKISDQEKEKIRELDRITNQTKKTF